MRKGEDGALSLDSALAFVMCVGRVLQTYAHYGIPTKSDILNLESFLKLKKRSGFLCFSPGSEFIASFLSPKILILIMCRVVII